MSNDITNNEDIIKLRTLFFAYSLSIIDLLLCQPFHEYIRFAIYSTIPLLAIYVIAKNGLKSIIFNTASVIILLTELLSGLMLFVHSEVMLHGLAALINILLFVVGFYVISTDALLDEAYKITKVLTIVTFIICIISFLIRPILITFPDLNKLVIFGHQFNFKDIALSDYRWKGYARHPNQTGMICAAGIISSFILYLIAKNKKEMLIAIINLCLNASFLVIVSSRSPLLSACVFIISFLAYYLIIGGAKKNPHIRKRLKALIIASVVFLIIVALLAIALDTVKDYILYKIIRVNDIETATGRTELQKTILDEYYKKGQYFKGLSYSHIQSITNGYGPHNTFVEVLAAIGIPSLIMLVLSLVIPFFYMIILIFKRSTLSDTELLLTSIGFAAITSTIVQNSFEAAYVWELLGSSALERWLLCFPVIIWYNVKKRNQSLPSKISS